MYLIMRERYDKNFITNERVLKYKVPEKVFKERENAERYIHEEIPKVLKHNDPEYWKGPDTNQNHVQMIYGRALHEEFFKILHVCEGD